MGKVLTEVLSAQRTLISDPDDFVCALQYNVDAQLFYRELPKRLALFNLQVAEEKTHCQGVSRFQPTLKNRFAFLGFEFYWSKDKGGVVRVFR